MNRSYEIGDTPHSICQFLSKGSFLKEASLSGSLSKDDGVMRSSWINFILSPHLCPHWLSNPTLKTCENFSRCSRSFSILVDIWPLIPLNAQPCIALAKSIASHDKSCQKVCKIIDMGSENSLAQNPHYLFERMLKRMAKAMNLLTLSPSRHHLQCQSIRKGKRGSQSAVSNIWLESVTRLSPGNNHVDDDDDDDNYDNNNDDDDEGWVKHLIGEWN